MYKTIAKLGTKTCHSRCSTRSCDRDSLLAVVHPESSNLSLRVCCAYVGHGVVESTFVHSYLVNTSSAVFLLDTPLWNNAPRSY